MSENLQNLLGEFVKETGLDSIASAIVDLDGKELAYIIHGTFDKEFNSQREEVDRAVQLKAFPLCASFPFRAKRIFDANAPR